MRPVLIIGAALLVIIGLAVGVYFLFFAPKGGITVEMPGDVVFPDSGAFSPSANAPEVGEARAAGEEFAPRFVRISEGPVALGTVAFGEDASVSAAGEDATTTFEGFVRDVEVRYVERGSGNIYSYKKSAGTITRLTNQTVLGVQDVAWSKDGSIAYTRFLSEETGAIETYALRTDGEEGYFLETGLSQVQASPNNTLVTLLPSSAGSIATEANIDGSGAKTLLSSELSDIRIVPTKEGVFAYTKPSASIDGYGFLASSGFERLWGPLRGLALLPAPTGTLSLASYRSGNTIRLEVMSVSSRSVTTLPTATIVEKCVWTADAGTAYCAVPRALPQGMPDSWYQGAVTTSDRIWKIDMQTRLASLIIDPRERADVDIDAVKLSLDENGDVLTFINRTDGSLWLYDL